jgi:hypothetical protein
VADRHAIELFDSIRTLVKEETKHETERDRNTKSLLIRAMRTNRDYKNHSPSSFDRTQDLISLIETVERWEQKYENAIKDWKKKRKEINDLAPPTKL